MNLHTDFDYQTIELSPDYEGKVTATLISSKFNVGDRESVLYLHGYIDYFFHPHVCEKFINNDFDFYALDLRKYGRSILEHQRPNFCFDIEEYFEEITIAIRQINKTSNALIHLLGHSTGGLIASSYMNDGKEKSSIKSLILNSPFLDFNQPEFAKKQLSSRLKSLQLSCHILVLTGPCRQCMRRAYIKTITVNGIST
jgi:alpha-beta hydrolase superfamily lysophospholipase